MYRTALLLILVTAEAPQASAQRWLSQDAWPRSRFGVSGYAFLQGDAYWSDGKPAANRPVGISCPPDGLVYYQVKTDSAGAYEAWIGLPVVHAVPEDGQVHCKVHLEARPLDLQPAGNTVSVFFARTPDAIRPTRAPPLRARYPSTSAHFPTEPILAGTRVRALESVAQSDSLPRVWQERGALYLQDRLPEGASYRRVTVGGTRTGTDLNLHVLISPGTPQYHNLAGDASVYEARISDLPPGEYTLRIVTIISDDPRLTTQTRLPEKVVPNVQVGDSQ